MTVKPRLYGQYRQGDVFLREVDDIPASAKRVDGQPVVLAEGEAAGHFHRILEREGVYMSESEEGEIARRWLSVDRASVDLVHPEHGTIRIPLGNYEVIRQREYQPEGAREVVD